MASKKPLVLNTDGSIEQLQSGDSLNATVNEVDVVSMTVGTGGVTAFDAVYVSAADTIIKAKADSGSTKNVLGLALTTASAAASVSVQTNGVVVGMSGLTAGALYYLSGGTAGALTTTAPTTGWVVQLGIAISTTSLYLDPQPSIKL
jgi:hypothetical protein